MKTVTSNLPGYLLAVLIMVFSFSVSYSQEKEAGSDDLSNLSLEDLLNIEVTTASKSAEKISDAAGVVSVVTQDELQRFGATNLRDILERVPSLNSASVYMTDRTVIAARGDQVMPSSSHVLLLINGRPVRETLEGGIKSEMYESFPVNLLERIEVIRGPGSVLYGSTAFSAVINLITKKSEENNVSVTALTGGSNNHNVMADFQYNSGDFSIIAGGRTASKKDWNVNWSADPSPFPGVPDDAVFTYPVTIPDKGNGLYAELNYNKLRAMFSYADWKNNHFVADYAQFAPFGNVFWRNSFSDIGYTFDVTDNYNMDVNLTYSRSKLVVDNWPGSNRDSYEIVAEWANYYRPSDNIKFTFGGLYNKMKGREQEQGSGLYLSDGQKYTISGYAQADYRAVEWAKIIAGVQINKVEELDVDINPRLGVIVYPSDYLNIKVLYSQAFRAPSLNELTIDYVVMQGNPNLKPEKVNTIDIGINYQGDQGTAGVNYYYSKMTNIIYQDRVHYAVPTYDNVGEVTIHGVELEGKYYFSKELFFTGSSLIQSSKDKDGNENVTPIPTVGVKAGLSYMSDNGLTLSLFNVYSGAVEDKYKSKLNVSPDSYNMLNLYAKYDLNKVIGLSGFKELALVLNVNNLLDKEIWLPNWGLVNGAGIPVYNGRVVSAGLSARL